MTLDERLRDLLGAEVPTPPGYVERVMGALPAQSHPSGYHPLVALAAAAVVVIAAGLVLTVMGGLAPRPTPIPSPSGSPTAPPLSPSPAPSLGAWTQVTVTRTAPFSSAAADHQLAGTAWPGGFLVISGSTTADAPGTLVWRSTDGITWSSSTTAAFAGTNMVWLTWTGQRLIAVGATADTTNAGFPWSGTIWTSTDGLAWTAVPDPEGLLAHMEPDGIATASAGVVIIGNRAAGQPVVLHSSEGLAWSADDTSGAPFTQVSVRSVAATDSGFLIGGSVVPPGRLTNGGPPPATALLRSTDGTTWQAAVPPFPQAVLNLVAAGHQVLTWGTTCVSCIGGSVLAASTDDGTTWRPVTVGDFDQMMMATTGDRVVRWTLHQEPSTPHAVALTWSDDGTAWHPVEVNPSFDPSTQPDLLMVHGDRLVVIGFQQTGTATTFITASGTFH